jgi:mycothiol system anti-sigma-R factor
VTGGPDSVDSDCSATLQRLFLFLDNEIDQATTAEIQEHLDDCAPCLAKYDLERIVKMLVARSCCERAPSSLRNRVLMAIHQVQVTVTSTPSGTSPADKSET